MERVPSSSRLFYCRFFINRFAFKPIESQPLCLKHETVVEGKALPSSANDLDFQNSLSGVCVNMFFTDRVTDQLTEFTASKS